MKRLHLTLAGLAIVVTTFAQKIDSAFIPRITDTPVLAALAAQSDGKIVISGRVTTVGSVSVEGLFRLNADGSVDTTFHPAVFADINNLASSLSVDNDGKILACGWTSFGVSAIRLNPDGSIDHSFQLSSAVTNLRKLIPYDGNRYLAVSWEGKTVYRIAQDGSVDDSFDAGTGPDDVNLQLEAVCVTPEGKIYVGGGFTTFNGVAANGIVRLNADGSVDQTFNSATGVGGVSPTVKSVALHAHNRVIIAGNFTTYDNISSHYVARLNENGSLDTTFVTSNIPSDFFQYQIASVIVEGDDVYMAGLKPYSFDYSILKVNAQCDIDASFNFTPVPYEQTHGEITDPKLLLNNSLLMSGNFSTPLPNRLYGLVSIKSDGTLDESFQPVLGGPATIRAMTIQKDGKVVIAGSFNSIDLQPVRNIARLNADATIDTTFENSLLRQLDHGIFEMAVQDDGKIVVGGAFTKAGDQYTGMLIRINPDGSFDSTFHVHVWPKYIGLGVNVIRILKNGQILIGGLFDNINDVQQRNLALLNPDGSLDQAFHDAVPELYQVNDIEIQNNGDILIAGGIHPYDGGFLFSMNESGEVLNDYPDVDLSGVLLKTIGLFPNNRFVTGGTLTQFSSFYPNPIFQFDSLGRFATDTAVTVYNGSVVNLTPVSNRAIVMTGNFTRVNGDEVGVIARASLIGHVSKNVNYGFPENSIIYDIEKDQASKSYYMIGSFNRLSQKPFFGIARLDLNYLFKPTPQAPKVDTASSDVLLTWTDNADNEDGYYVKRSGKPSSNSGRVSTESEVIVLDTLAEDAYAFVDTTTVSGFTYDYTIVAFNSAGQASSDAITATIEQSVVLSAPSNLVSAVGSGQFTLSWSDMSANESGFEIQMSVNETDFAPVANVDANTTTYSFANSTTAEKVWFRVRSFDASVFSDWVATSVVIPPQAPADFMSTLESGHFTLSWSDLSNNESGFELQTSENGTDFELLANVESNITTYHFENAATTQSFWWRIRSYHNSGASDWVSTSLVITSAEHLSAEGRVYPNPTNGPLTILNPTAIELDLVVADALGRQFQHRSTADHVVHLNLESLPPGIYYLIIDQGGLRLTSKVLKY